MTIIIVCKQENKNMKWLHVALWRLGTLGPCGVKQVCTIECRIQTPRLIRWVSSGTLLHQFC